MDEGKPAGKVGVFILKAILRLMKIEPKDLEDDVTEEDLILRVSEGHQQGVIEEGEARMINNILEFSDKEVSDIMNHRKNVIAIDVNTRLKDAAVIMANEKYSRYPVYENDVENIVGILHLKDVLRCLVDPDDTNDKITHVMRQPMFVPVTMHIGALFKQMQQKKMHMAIAIDEYGQTGGIVAMEDVLEEIVGNIQDEYDEEESLIHPLEDGSYLMKGMTSIEEVQNLLDIDFEEDFDTLNGLLIHKLDYIPTQEDKDQVQLCGYIFDIVSVKDQMIDQVRVFKEPEAPEALGEEEA